MIAVQLLGFAPFAQYRLHPTAECKQAHAHIAIVPVKQRDGWRQFAVRSAAANKSEWSFVNEYLSNQFMLAGQDVPPSTLARMYRRDSSAVGVWIVYLDVDPERAATVCGPAYPVRHELYYRGRIF